MRVKKYMILFAAALSQPTFELASGSARLQFNFEGGAWRMAAFRPGDREAWMESAPASPGRFGAGFRWESCRVTPGKAELSGRGPDSSAAQLTIAAQGEGEFLLSYRLQKDNGFKAASALEWWRSGRPVQASIGRLGGQQGATQYGPLELWNGRINGGEASVSLAGEGLKQGPLVNAVKDSTGFAWGPLAAQPVQFPDELTYQISLDLTPGDLVVAEPETSLPQALPWLYVCRPLVTMGVDPLRPEEADLLPEGARRLWGKWSLDGFEAGGPVGEDIAWGETANAQAAAYGLLAWGTRLEQGSWVTMGHELTSLLLAGQGRPFSKDGAFGSGAPDAGTTSFWLRESLPFLNDQIRPQAEAMLTSLALEAAAEEPVDLWKLTEPTILSDLPWANGMPLQGAALASGSKRVELTATLDQARRLMLAGDKLQSAALMRLGAAGLRSAFGMLSFGLQTANHMPKPNVFDGRTVSGFDLETGRWLEPSTFLSGPLYLMAHTALADQKFGDAYELKTGEKVGLNAISMTDKGPVSLLSKIQFPYTDQEQIRVGQASGGWREEAVVKPMDIRGLRMALHDGQVGAEAVPSSVMLGGPGAVQAEFLIDGKPFKSQFSELGYFSPIGSPEAAPSSIEAQLSINGRLVGSARLVNRITDDPFDWPYRSGGMSSYRWKSLPGGWISTADNGAGSMQPGLQGSLRSLPFLAAGSSLTFEYESRGRVFLELWDVDAQMVLDQVPLDERATGVGVMDLGAYTGKRVQLILRDEDGSGWVQLRRPQQG